MGYSFIKVSFIKVRDDLKNKNKMKDYETLEAKMRTIKMSEFGIHFCSDITV